MTVERLLYITKLVAMSIVGLMVLTAFNRLAGVPEELAFLFGMLYGYIAAKIVLVRILQTRDKP